MSVNETPLWRLDEGEKFASGVVERKRNAEKSGVTGEVVVRLLGPNGEVVREMSRPCFFPLDGELGYRVSVGATGVNAVDYVFPARVNIDGQRVDGVVEWFWVSAADSARTSEADLLEAARSRTVPRFVLEGRAQPSAIGELQEVGDGDSPPIAMRKFSYNLPENFKLEVFDGDGNRCGLDGVRYRPRDGMPE